MPSAQIWKSASNLFFDVSIIFSQIHDGLLPQYSALCGALPRASSRKSWFSFDSRFQSRKATPREERSIKMRFGLEDGTEYTLGEVGQIFGVTRERIRQIEAKAFRKLRHPSRNRRPRTFF